MATATRARPRAFRIANRVARRYELAIALALLLVWDAWREQVDEAALERAIQGQQGIGSVETAAGIAVLALLLMRSPTIERDLLMTTRDTGSAATDALRALGFDGTAIGLGPPGFVRSAPNIGIAVARQLGVLTDTMRGQAQETVRAIMAFGAAEGLSAQRVALAIREAMPLRAPHALAPLRFEAELRAKDTRALRRLLHDPSLPPAQQKAMAARVAREIRARFDADAVTEEWIERHRLAYIRNLEKRRALDIARTETMRSANFGLREAWRQAVQSGALPQDVRRRWVNVLDNRLRPTHAAIPGLNPDGVGLDEPFLTPLGYFLDPPIEINCRCSVSLGVGPAGVL